jgi:hypothetical protein
MNHIKIFVFFNMSIKNQIEVCKYLATPPISCDVHLINSYGCNATMWGCQVFRRNNDVSTHLTLELKHTNIPHVFSQHKQGAADIELLLYLRELGVSFDLLNNHGQGCLHKAAQVYLYSCTNSDAQSSKYIISQFFFLL